MKRILSTIILAAAAVAAVLLFSSSTKPQEGLRRAYPEDMGMDPAKFAYIDSIIGVEIDRKIFSGATIAIVRRDRLVYLKAYGNKSVVPCEEPMTEGTMMDMASCTKSIGTALPVMQLVEKGLIRLDDEVRMYIPEFWPGVTIKHLLTHSSGLQAYVKVPECVERFGENCPDKLMHYIATELPLLFKPGTGVKYSCLNFITLQNIVEKVTGMRLCDYAQKYVYDVLGLKHTMYLPMDREAPQEILDLVAPTEVQEDGVPLHGKVHDPLARLLCNGNAGNAGVFSTAEDCAVIAAAILNGGAVNGRRILSPLTVERMAAVPEELQQATGKCLGWDNRASGTKGELTSRHNTLSINGYTGPAITIDLDNGLAVVFLCNRCHPVDGKGVSRTRAIIANIAASAIVE